MKTRRTYWTSLLAILLLAILSTGCARLSSYFDGDAWGSATLANGPSASDRTREGRLKFARLCQRKGQFEQAEKIYQALLKENPKDPEALHRMGVLAAEQGRYPKSMEYFNAATSVGSPSADLLCDLGYCYYLQNRWSDAERTLRKALKDQPNHARSCTNLGLVLGLTGRYEESLAVFRRSGTEAQAQANLAYVYTQIGAEDDALAAYHKALALDPEMRVAAEALMQLAQRQVSRKQINARAEAQLAAVPGAALPNGMPPDIAAALPVEIRPGRELLPPAAGAPDLQASPSGAPLARTGASIPDTVTPVSAMLERPAPAVAKPTEHFGFSGAAPPELELSEAVATAADTKATAADSKSAAASGEPASASTARPARSRRLGWLFGGQ